MVNVQKQSEVAFTLLSCRGSYIFQHRDDNPSITAPGLYAGFGGAIEDLELPVQAAARELREETSLLLKESQLSYLGKIELEQVSGGARYVFIAEIEICDFVVKEGQGKVSFTKGQLAYMDLEKFTPTTAEAIKRFILE